MLPTDAKARKDVPLYRGLLLYFPDACAAVAELSRIGNDQHNPGQPMHWAREKSTDHGDCILRHQIDAGKVDSDGVRHATKVAWRALAQLQLELEAAAAKPVGMTAPEMVDKLGWHSWAGATLSAPLPLKAGDLVEVQYADGSHEKNKAAFFRWWHVSPNAIGQTQKFNIIAYRIIP